MTEKILLQYTDRGESEVTQALSLFREREKTAKLPERSAACDAAMDTDTVADWHPPNCVASILTILYPSFLPDHTRITAQRCHGSFMPSRQGSIFFVNMDSQITGKTYKGTNGRICPTDRYPGCGGVYKL